MYQTSALLKKEIEEVIEFHWKLAKEETWLSRPKGARRELKILNEMMDEILTEIEKSHPLEEDTKPQPKKPKNRKE